MPIVVVVRVEYLSNFLRFLLSDIAQKLSSHMFLMSPNIPHYEANYRLDFQ